MIWSSSLERRQAIQPQMDQYASVLTCHQMELQLDFELGTLGLLQVKVQKDSEVRLKIIGTRVDATEIVCT